MFNYTFLDEDEGKSFDLIATAAGGLRASIILNVNESVPIISSGEAGSFPQGTSSESFVLICQLNKVYRNSLDVNLLNEYAYDYLSNLGLTVDRTVKYYSQDDNGIYIYIIKEEGMSYDNEVVTINGDECYQVYIGGRADIIGFQRKAGATGKYELQLSNGFYKAINNKLYLFVADTARLVHVTIENDEPKSFYYNGETFSDNKIFTDSSIYQEGSYYISIGDNCSINTIKEPETETAVNYVFKDGDIDAIITSNTMTRLEHFADIVNANKIVLSNNIKEIGNYCFYGSLVSGTITLETNVLETIGEYAFANMSNLNLLNINSTDDGFSHMPASLKSIGNKAFMNSSGLNKISFSECTSLVNVGNEVFEGCGNLRYVDYLQSQVEPDGISATRLLYLPPERGSDGNYAPRNSTSAGIIVTASYGYDYNSTTANPEITPEEINNSQRTFLNCTNIHWKCL